MIARVKYEVLPRIRVVTEEGTIALGPGKAGLLDAIRRHGTIRGAAEELGMSYMRAWTLIRTMNAAFASPLVEKTRGGADQGGAQLTRRGETVLTLYRTMEKTAARAIRAESARLRRQLR